MKITIVGSFPPSGIFLNEHTAHMVYSLAKNKDVQITVIADKISSPELDANPPYKIVRCWRHNSWLSLFRIYKEVLRSEPDIVWFNLVLTAFSDQPIKAFASLMLPLVMRLRGFFVAVTLHAVVERINFALTKHRRFARVKRFFAISAQRFLLKSNVVFVFLDKYVEILRSRYLVENVYRTRHGVEGGELSRSNYKTDPNILVFGRFGAYKNLDLAFTAFKMLRETIPAAKLTIAGSSHPSYPDYYDHIKQKYKDTPNVTFRDYIPEEELESLFTSHSIVWLPYNSSTGISGVALRACRFGMPLVMPDVPDFTEMRREEGLDAEFFRTGNARSAADVMANLIKHPDRMLEMGETNASTGRRWSTQKVVGEQLDLLKKLLPQYQSEEKSVGLELCLLLTLSLLWNFLILQTGQFRATYDAFIHIFFASTYARHWFDTWTSGWYGGFDLASYPPLTHQLIALLSKFFGLINGYKIVQGLTFPIITLGVFRFAKLWLSNRAALDAAFASIFLTSTAQAAYQWGQLPTTFALGFLLHGLASIALWIQRGSIFHFFAGTLSLLVTLVSHHISITFGLPLFFSAIAFAPVVNLLLRRRDDEGQFKRLFAFGTLFIPLAALTLIPFLTFVLNNKLVQVPIFHGSRDNFIENAQAFCLFWVIPWGALLIFFPVIVGTSYRRTGMHGLLFSWIILTLLGLGGTIPSIKYLLGPMFDVLTLDRFTLWGTIAILPFVGIVMAAARPFAVRFTLITAFILSNLLYIWGVQHYKFQPDPIPTKKIVRFLETSSQKYRYLTLGFGSQLAWLSANTRVQSIDGLYHTVRPFSVLRESGIEALDGAKYFGEKGLAVLNHFLTEANTYHLKYIFNSDPFYDNILTQAGWTTIRSIEKNVTLWEKKRISEIPDEELNKKSSLSKGYLLIWGCYPLILLALCILVTARWLWRNHRPKHLPQNDNEESSSNDGKNNFQEAA